MFRLIAHAFRAGSERNYPKTGRALAFTPEKYFPLQINMSK
jgi:hypothetical protein